MTNFVPMHHAISGIEVWVDPTSIASFIRQEFPKHLIDGINRTPPETVECTCISRTKGLRHLFMRETPQEINELLRGASPFEDIRMRLERIENILRSGRP